MHMRDLFRLPILSMICILALVGCNNATSSKSSKVNAKIDGDVLVIDADTTQSHTIQVSVGKVTFSTSLRGGEEFNIMDSLKNHKDAHYELAYTLAQNKGLMDAHLSIPNKLDTTIQCQYKYNDIWGHSGQLTSGKFAKIVNTFDSENIDSELRRWVYKNKKVNIGDTLFNDMRLYLRDLNTTTDTRFVVQEKIPSIKLSDFKGLRYNVSSDMVADNYFLFACDEDIDLDYFIEEMIARNMSDAEKSFGSPLYCFSQDDASGTQCIFLVGINNDWTNQVLPLGVISVDGTAPSYSASDSALHSVLSQRNTTSGLYSNSSEFYMELEFPKRGFIIDVSNQPKVSGWWYVDFGDFEGYNPYKIPYTLSWSGDVSKIVIYNRTSTPTSIDLSNKQSPYHITLATNCPNFGDNYIKLEAFDKIGNKSTTDIKIAVERIRNDSPQINIDNNIWN